MLFLLLVRSEYWLRLKMLCLGSDLKIRSIAHRARHLRPGRQQTGRHSSSMNHLGREVACPSTSSDTLRATIVAATLHVKK